MNKLIILLCILAISNQCTAQIIPALISTNIKIGEIYYGESDDGVAYDQDWREVCRKLDLLLTNVPGGKFCEYPSTNPVYLWLGDICLDGSYRFSGRGQFCDQDIARCPDSSWTLSADQKTCYRQDGICRPNPAEVPEEKLLAAIAYGEASTKDNYEELAAIASATLRAKAAKGFDSLSDLVEQDSDYSKVINDGNIRYKKVMCADADLTYQKAFAAAKNALHGGKDYSGGGCFWDGVDLKTYGKKHYRYVWGFRFTNPSHNIYGVTEPRPKKRTSLFGSYSYTYESTAAHGGTIFWRYTQEYLAATKGTQCN